MDTKRTCWSFGTRCEVSKKHSASLKEATPKPGQGDLPLLLERLDRLHALARERLIQGEARYRGAWRQRDNLAEAEEEAADAVNYLVFALEKARLATQRPVSDEGGGDGGSRIREE